MLSGLDDAEADLQPFRFQVEGQGRPLQNFIGITPITADEGTCVFAVIANAWLCSQSGSIQGGVMGLVIERAAWGAVLAELAAGESCRTLDMKINYFQQMVQGSGILRAIGEVMHKSRRIAVASVRIEDEDGRSLAFATATVGVTRAAA